MRRLRFLCSAELFFPLSSCEHYQNNLSSKYSLLHLCQQGMTLGLSISLWAVISSFSSPKTLQNNLRCCRCHRDLYSGWIGFQFWLPCACLRHCLPVCGVGLCAILALVLFLAVYPLVYPGTFCLTYFCTLSQSVRFCDSFDILFLLVDTEFCVDNFLRSWNRLVIVSFVAVPDNFCCCRLFLLAGIVFQSHQYVCRPVPLSEHKRLNPQASCLLFYYFLLPLYIFAYLLTYSKYLNLYYIISLISRLSS